LWLAAMSITRVTLIELLGMIRAHDRNSFIGQCDFEETARTYSASRTAFNRSIRNDVNMCVFEGVACGSLLLTNDSSDNGQAELFENGVHLATYREAEDLLDKLGFTSRATASGRGSPRPGRGSRSSVPAVAALSIQFSGNVSEPRLLAQRNRPDRGSGDRLGAGPAARAQRRGGDAGINARRPLCGARQPAKGDAAFGTSSDRLDRGPARSLDPPEG
jgi:hypothetical protein